MENLIFSVNAVVPIFIVGAIGYLLVQRGVLTTEFADTASNACFKLFLPVMIFKEVYNSKILEDFNVLLVVYCIGSILLLVAVSSLVWPFFIKDRARCGAAVHSTFRSNFVLMGIPILTNMYGTGGNLAAASVLPFAVTTFNICAVVVFTIYAPLEGDVKGISIPKLIKSIVKNPFILGIVAGIFCLALQIKLPVFLGKSVDNIAAMASPLALLAVGAQFDFKKAKDNIKLSATVSLLRLTVAPLVFVVGGYLCGFRGAELSTIYILFGCPTAVSGAALAQSMGSDGRLTGEITLVSSLFSVFTLCIGVMALRAIGAA